MVALRLAAPLVASLVLVSGASGAIRFGIAGDSGKYGDDSGAFFYKTVTDVGFTENRVTVTWDVTDPGVIKDQAFLDRSLPIAAREGVRVIFTVYPATATAFATDVERRVRLFAGFVTRLAQRYPQVTTYIVGNEPNQPRFWRPQFASGGKPVAAATFEHLLAASYDALKGVNPAIVVAGVGLSPRGNDSPGAPSNVSRSPVRFIAELAAEYRKSKRPKPIMDLFAFHPYPNANDDPVSRGYAWPNAGIPDLDRIKQAVWDGFHGTAQPVFGEAGNAASSPLRLMLDEYARQVDVPPSLSSRYSGTENVPTVDEATQAAMYSSVLRRVACDPSVSDFFLFHLVDEPDLDRFQSGLLRIDLSHRPSYAAVAGTIAALHGTCGGTQHRWRHTTSVVGARVRFARGAARISVGELALARVGPVPEGTGRAAMLKVLKGKHARSLRPGGTAVLGVRAGLSAGRYVPVVQLQATLNPARQRLVIGPAFSVG
jgi:hypothetical protein